MSLARSRTDALNGRQGATSEYPSVTGSGVYDARGFEPSTDVKQLLIELQDRARTAGVVAVAGQPTMPAFQHFLPLQVSS